MSQLTLASTTDSEDDILKALGQAQATVETPPAAEPPPAAPSAPPPAATAGSTEPPPPPTKPKPATTRAEDRKAQIQGEIKALIAERYTTDRQLQAAREELARLRGELAGLQSQRPPVTVEPPVAAPPPAPAAEPEPAQDQFETLEQYYAAHARWVARQEVRQELTAKTAELTATLKRELDAQRQADEARHTRSAQVAQDHEAARLYSQRLDAFKESRPDEYAAIEAGGDVPMTPPLMDVALYNPRGPEVMHYLATHPEEATHLAESPITPPMRDVIATSAHAPELVAYLGSHPQEIARIARLHPGRQLAEMGHLAGRLSAAPAAAPPPAPPAAPTVAAPVRRHEPMATVGASRTTATSVPLDDPNLSQAEFNRRRNEEIRRRLRGR